MYPISNILCSMDWHKWKESWLKYETRRFHVRDCEKCQRREVEQLGLFGDSKWHDIDASENWDHRTGAREKECYLGAKPE